jgi:hypothetical protein
MSTKHNTFMVIKITQPSRVFIAGPLRMFSDPKGNIDPTVVRVVKLLLRRLRHTGHYTFNAHELEKWGKETNKHHLTDLFKRDLQGVMAADYFFIVPAFNGKLSNGTFTEIAALRERMIAPRIPTDKYAPVKGVIFLHHKGSHDEYLDKFAGELKQKFPKLIEIVKFSKPSDLVRAVRARTFPLKGIVAKRAAAKLALEQKRNRPIGATYFTKKQRRRVI